jgi:hypothetical protein
MMVQIETKTVFDFLQLMLPMASGIGLAIGGWIFSYKIAKIGFQNEIKREQYNKLRDSFVNINSLFIQLYEYLYTFINNAKNLYTKNMDMPEYELDEFSSKKMLKINMIFNLINIDFSEIDTNINEYNTIANNIERFYTKLRNIIGKSDSIETYINEMVEVSKIISQLTKISNELLIKMNNALKKNFLLLKK